VDRVSPGADRYTIVAYLRADGLIAPSGTFVRANLFGSEEVGALRVPAEALVRRGPLTGVYVVQDGRAALRWLRLSPDGRVQAGLTENEVVVLEPPVGLEDGDRVEVTR
jgi:membrane fusion protein (multidrug efflux system)